MNKRWILTAAHCLWNVTSVKDEIGVYAGTTDCTGRRKQLRMMNITSFRIHPRYGIYNDYDHDIALIQIQESFHFTKSVLPACLPKPEVAVDLMSPGTNGVTSGCGIMTSKASLKFPAATLRYVKVPIQDENTCVKSSTNVDTLPGSAFCAGYAKQGQGDACKGDSGGGLVVERDNRWFVVGLVSYGEDCDKYRQYGFYTNVSNYYYWIKAFIGLSLFVVLVVVVVVVLLVLMVVAGEVVVVEVVLVEVVVVPVAAKLFFP